MTSATAQLHNEIPQPTSQTAFVPAVALWVALALAQQSGVFLSEFTGYSGRASAQLTTVMTNRDLFGELIQFHQRLAAAQTDLPEDAARVLRENLWHLYD